MVRWLKSLAGNRDSIRTRSLANSSPRSSRDWTRNSELGSPAVSRLQSQESATDVPFSTTRARPDSYVSGDWTKRSNSYNEIARPSHQMQQQDRRSEAMRQASSHQKRPSPPILAVPENPALAKALLEAADKGQLTKVEELLDCGAPIAAVDRFGLNVLHKAASRGNTELVEVLLARGANIKQVGWVCGLERSGGCVASRRRVCVCV